MHTYIQLVFNLEKHKSNKIIMTNSSSLSGQQVAFLIETRGKANYQLPIENSGHHD